MREYIGREDAGKMTAQEYAIKDNKLTQAWVDEDPKDRWAGLYPEEDEYWAEQAERYKLKTGADVMRRDLIAAHYDGYKEKHDIRPRWINYTNKSYEEIERMVEEL